jgi:hypothetical protein
VLTIKLKLDFILLLAGIHASTAGCRRWLGKCTKNDDCCNNRRCMKWGRCSLVHHVPRKVYKCFESRVELIAGVKSYLDGNETEKELVKDIYGNPIGKWCVDKVTDFESLFDVNIYAYISKVTNMEEMFLMQDLSIKA